MADLIQPRTLKGFRDYLPALMIPREYMLDQARRVYRSYGFAPIDTPALEYEEILRGKAGEESDKLIYSFEDHGNRRVALRFDLTVPFARFVAQYIGQIGTPFKRYAMGPVWRGENTGHGRYREFWQCDFDTIGTTSNASDIEVALVIHDLMRAWASSASRSASTTVWCSTACWKNWDWPAKRHRFCARSTNCPRSVPMRCAPKWPTRAASAAPRPSVCSRWPGCRAAIPRSSRASSASSALIRAADGIARLRELVTVAREAGVADERIRLDLSIARGLDYYTGTIYETFLTDKPDIGSVCSGGRYDNLANLYTKQVLPGVGASLGLDRLLAAMEEMNLLPKVSTPAPVLLVQFAPEYMGAYQRMARHLRGEGIGVEVYPEAKKVGQQLKYAESRGFRVALIAGPDEFTQGMWQIKDLARREMINVPGTEVVPAIHTVLSAM